MVMHHSIRDEDWIRQEVIGCQKQPSDQKAASAGCELCSIVARAMPNKGSTFLLIQRLCNKPQIVDFNGWLGPMDSLKPQDTHALPLVFFCKELKTTETILQQT